MRHHDWTWREGSAFGKVAVMRNGEISRRSNGEVIYYPPEDVRRGDIILGPDLRPLRFNPNRKKGLVYGRRRRHSRTDDSLD